VRENGGDLEASGALNIHEKAVGRLDKSLKLVLLLLLSLGRKKKISGHLIYRYSSVTIQLSTLENKELTKQ
jgi:hypothetical protein